MLGASLKENVEKRKHVLSNQTTVLNMSEKTIMPISTITTNVLKYIFFFFLNVGLFYNHNNVPGFTYIAQ